MPLEYRGHTNLTADDYRIEPLELPNDTLAGANTLPIFEVVESQLVWTVFEVEAESHTAAVEHVEEHGTDGLKKLSDNGGDVNIEVRSPFARTKTRTS